MRITMSQPDSRPGDSGTPGEGPVARPDSHNPEADGRRSATSTATSTAASTAADA